MKTIIALTALIWGAGAGALPPYLPELRGVALNTLTSTDDFALTPGTLGECESKAVAGFLFYSCPVSGAVARVTGANGVSREFHFTSARISLRSTKTIGAFSEYTLTGTWSHAGPVPLNSPVTLVLWHPNAAPDDIKGSLRLNDYGVQIPIQATR